MKVNVTGVVEAGCDGNESVNAPDASAEAVYLQAALNKTKHHI
jgi:hypothetical protein